MKLLKLLLKADIDTTIVDVADRILNTYLDKEFTDILETNAQQHGLHFKGGETVKSISGNQNGEVTTVVTDKMNMTQILSYLL